MLSIILGLAPLLCSDDNFKLISKEKHEVLCSHIPDSKDGVLKSIRENKKLVIYSEKEMPRAYQDFAGGLPGIHSPKYNISADKPREKFGNPNVEFPWGNSAGTELVDDEHMSSFRFFILPENQSIDLYREYLPGDSRPTWIWKFPKGTIFGEVLQLYHKECYHTFEVRLRKKDLDWRVSVYKPFSTLKEFGDFCRANDTILYYKDKRISQSHQIFKGDVITTCLEEIPESLVKKALKKEFTNVIGQEWHENAHAPTTDVKFHIIPKGYQAATIASDSNSCVRCHDSILKHASDLEPFRDWYGRVRGSDGIFSWHPFDPSCISYGGFYQGEIIRKSFLDNGIVKMRK